MSSQNFFKTSTSGAFRPSSAFELINLALERQKAAFRDEFTMVTQAMIQLVLPTIDGIGLHTVNAAQLNDWRASLPLLEYGKLLFGGNTVAATALNR